MDTIKVLMVEPQKAPYVAKIENTLAGQQLAVHKREQNLLVPLQRHFHL